MNVLAATEAGAPPYLTLAAALVVAAALFGYLSVRLKVVPIVGFLLAGVLIGPSQLGLVAETEAVDAAAEIGVILLLFTIGIEFSLGRLAGVWRWIVFGGGLQVALATASGLGLVVVLGGGVRVGVFTGFLIALSSTAIVLKINADTGASNTVRGQLALAVLIFQDLAVVAMVLLVPFLGQDSAGGAGELAQALGVAVLVVTGVLVVARRVMPAVLERIAALCSPEVFLLAVLGICLGTAYLTSLAGVSVSLGAFLAGLVVSESRQSTQAFTEVLPLQIIFSAVFFISVGMLLDVGFLLDNIGVVLAAAVVVLLTKVVTTSLALLGLRVGWRPALASALLLGQVGEFSFVLVTAGAAVNLSPAGLGDRGSQIFVATTVLLMLLTPLLSVAGQRLTAARSTSASGTPDVASRSRGPREDHVVIVGWGPVSLQLGRSLLDRGVQVTLTTLNPLGAREAEEAGLDVISGDALHRQVLLDAGVTHAKAVIIAENEVESATRTATTARTLTSAPILLRPLEGVDLEAFADAGVDHVVDPDSLSHQALLTAALDPLGLPGPTRRDRAPSPRPESSTSTGQTTEVAPTHVTACPYFLAPQAARSARWTGSSGCTCGCASPAGTSDVATPHPVGTPGPTTTSTCIHSWRPGRKDERGRTVSPTISPSTLSAPGDPEGVPGRSSLDREELDERSGRLREGFGTGRTPTSRTVVPHRDPRAALTSGKVRHDHPGAAHLRRGRRWTTVLALVSGAVAAHWADGDVRP